MQAMLPDVQRAIIYPGSCHHRPCRYSTIVKCASIVGSNLHNLISLDVSILQLVVTVTRRILNLVSTVLLVDMLHQSNTCMFGR